MKIKCLLFGHYWTYRCEKTRIRLYGGYCGHSDCKVEIKCERYNLIV